MTSFESPCSNAPPAGRLVLDVPTEEEGGTLVVAGLMAGRNAPILPPNYSSGN
jgi:hypothetical protein